MSPILRFAPSPNGRLHLGHAFSAVLNFMLARRLGGRFLLRIEDIDPTRCKPEFTVRIYEDLRWLGLCWEEPVRIQSEHFEDYRRAFAFLKQQGLVYPCFCSRTQIAALAGGNTDPDGAPLYSGACRAMPPSEAEKRMADGGQYCWRLDMRKALLLCPQPLTAQRFALPGMQQVEFAAQPARWGDVILVRKETPTSYHLSVVVDDALQGVTHVVRGADLEAATDLHVLLQRLLGLPTPLYHHHALIQGGEGEKLSKSRQSETMADLRERGVSPEEIMRMLGMLS